MGTAVIEETYLGDGMVEEVLVEFIIKSSIFHSQNRLNIMQLQITFLSRTLEKHSTFTNLQRDPILPAIRAEGRMRARSRSAATAEPIEWSVANDTTLLWDTSWEGRWCGDIIKDGVDGSDGLHQLLPSRVHHDREIHVRGGHVE
jgi:hypothetical protein